MTFESPHLLWLLFLPPLIMALAGQDIPAISFPHARAVAAIPRSTAAKAAALVPWLGRAGILLAIVALARPQLVNTRTSVTSKGVDIVLAMDLSSSMLAVDAPAAGKRNRLATEKALTQEFIKARSGDRLAVVAFGARAYPVAPLTTDRDFLLAAVERLQCGEVEDGTAVGDAVLAAVNRLRQSPPQSRTVILLTDGRSNTGAVAPAAAASAAAALGVKVHCIGIGGRGGALFPVEDPLGGVTWRPVPADLDEQALKGIAGATGGRYFRADEAGALRAAFSEIDRLEKRTLVEKRQHSVKELCPGFLYAALLLVALEQLLLAGRLRSLP